ncbi:MerR HTH family regulatory protein [Spirosomataceae bacterium TFI 002]|nr:MerR HTH family regulatory protein [Spirosomataceae bacterium TFI 002]
MKQEHLISTETICTHYNIEVTFVDSLYNMGLIEIEVVEQSKYIHKDGIGDLEKILRLHNELNVNLEGIDVVLQLLEKERKLREEVSALKNRLRLYEEG